LLFPSDKKAKSIPPRDPNAPANLINLTSFYNSPLNTNWHGHSDLANDLSDLPRGTRTFSGVQFDVRGLIQTALVAPDGRSYPSFVPGMRVGRSCQRLHFLHAAAAGPDAHDGDQLGAYIIHYANGRQMEIPIVVGKDLADWWSQANEEHMTFLVAWSGRNPEATSQGHTIRLFKTTWRNPFPEVPIDYFDFLCHKPASGAPFLVAVTAEP
jgi:hypothetical protein